MEKGYNVIWIDDEWDKMTEFKDECEDLHIHLQPFSYQKAAMEELDKHPNSWDAVLLDGEIKDKSEHEEPSTKGLLNALMYLAEKHKQIPRFISTGKDKVKDNEMLKDEHIYIKDVDDEKLFDDIRNTIDSIERYKVKLLYKDVLELLSSINKDVCESIISIFEKMHNPDADISFNSKLYYNQIRQALECIYIVANKKGVIPDECCSGGRPNIDQCYRYLVGDPAFHAGVRYGQQGEYIVPEYIGAMMAMIKNIGNEFSHPNENNKTHYLLYSLALNLYEIGIWMFRYIEEHPNREENLKKCTKIEKPMNDDLEGIIEVQKIYHIGKRFGVNPGFVMKNGLVGKKVKVVKYGANTDVDLNKLYPYFAYNIQQVEEQENGSK
jgi:hypothetical protein